MIERFNDAGAVTLGKTNMDEFAMDRPTKLPFVRSGTLGSQYGAGRQFRGSAAAVAARLVPGATATDTGGSIRQPAAYRRLRPQTYVWRGLRHTIAFASSLTRAERWHERRKMGPC